MREIAKHESTNTPCHPLSAVKTRPSFACVADRGRAFAEDSIIGDLDQGRLPPPSRPSLAFRDTNTSSQRTGMRSAVSLPHPFSPESSSGPVASQQCAGSSSSSDGSSSSSSSDSSYSSGSSSSSPSPRPLSTSVSRPPSLPEDSSPYAGPFSGASWNARAFFCCKARKLGKNFDKVLAGLRNCDFYVLQETHSTQARAIAAQGEFGDSLQFWAHGSAVASGLGLIVSNSFASKFDHMSWHILVEGRLAVLRCWGKLGSLDIWAVYADAVCSPSRRSMIDKLSRVVAPQSSTLSILVGDFNFVGAAEDRITEGVWKGAHDKIDNDHLVDRVLQPRSFAELEQECFTYRSASLPTTFSRIDRVFSNHHVADQLQSDFFCGVLPWPSPELSDHRPVRFGRRPAAIHATSNLPAWTLTHPDWASRAQQYYVERLSGLPSRASPFQSLACLKDAFRDASSSVMREARWPEVRTAEDKLNLLLTFLKAVEQRNEKVIDKCRVRVDELFPNLNVSRVWEDRVGVGKVKDEVVELARQHYLTLHDLILEDKDNLPESVFVRKKEQIDKKFSKLVPGASSSICCISAGGGKILTDDEDIANVMAKHWEGVLTSSPIDHDLLQVWLEDLERLPEDVCWEPEEESMKVAVGCATESSPGPDGIPYRAYKIFPGAAHILFKVAILMLSVGDVCLPDGFNSAFLCCLPKKPSFTDPRLGPVFTAEGTRPLSIVNTDNRLIASFFRIHLEGIFSRWVSAAQRGFIRGRSMLANIIDVDLQAMKISLSSRRGAIILFDFKAAFPSVSHDYMWAVLERIGVPRKWIRALQRLYIDNTHRVKFRGKIFGSFTTSSGVRQGCPVSPLIFAVVADVLLRKLASSFPNQLIRAFADDTAMVVDDFHRFSEEIMRLFKEFGEISNLRLNLPKTVIIPLWSTSTHGLRTFLNSDRPEWKNVAISFASKYLGYLVGPDSYLHNWDAAVTKFRARVTAWSEIHLGMQYDCRVYRVFMFSLFGFLSQLTVPPRIALEAEQWALRKLVRGPGSWCTANDLFLLKDAYGFTFAFPSLCTVAQAAKLRVFEYEDIDFQEAAQSLARARLVADCDWVSKFDKWYDSSYVKVIADNEIACANKASSSAVVRLKILEDHPKVRPHLTGILIRRNFQAKAVELLLHNPGHAERRLRHRLERWRLSDPPAFIVRRAINRLLCIFKLVPPRVAVMLFNTYFNRWTTARRFQGKAKCLLCGVGQDSVEHTAYCEVQLAFARNYLHIPEAQLNDLQGFFGLNNGISDELLTLIALNLFACYTARNILSRNPLEKAAVGGLLVQIAKQAVMRHPKSRKVLESWS